jgi:hypothetical protein
MSFYRCVNIDDVYDDLRTGDLILFRSKRWIRYFTYFTHVGLIVDFHGKKYILDLNQKNFEIYGVKSGVKLYDMYNRINKFNGEIYFFKMNSRIMTNEKITRFFERMNDYFKIKFDSNLYVNIIKRKLGIRVTNRDGMFCSEFIGYILQDLNILDSKYDISLIFPKTFSKLKTDDDSYIYVNMLKLKNESLKIDLKNKIHSSK